MNPQVYVANRSLVDERLSESQIGEIINRFARRHPSIRNYQAIYIDFVPEAQADDSPINPTSPCITIGVTYQGVPLSGDRLKAVLEHRLNRLADTANSSSVRTHPQRRLIRNRPLLPA